jgi:ATP-binding cassette subfamily F protein uup
LNQKKVRQQTQLKQFEKQKQELRREQEWFREGVRARGTKDQGRLKRYYQLKEAHQNSRPNLENPVLPLPKIQPLGNKILILKNLTVNFIGEERNQRQECIVKDLNLEFEPSFRLGILGANGSGKTTLIQTILGEHSQQSGKIIYGQNTFFNYQDQKRQKLQQETTIIKEISNGNLEMPFGNTKTNVYAYLKKFLFHSQDLTKRIWELSGGQKARVLLAKILKQNGNFLILDEPTNDLDIDTMEALENTLVSFLGCVILVSHDRFFLDRVCTHILALEGEGRYTLSSGGYSRYMQKYGQEQDFWGQQPSRSKATNTPSQKQIKPTKTSSKDKRKARLELRNLEKDISKCQQKIDKLNQLVVAPDFYQKPSQEIRQILGNLDQQKKYLNSLENRWLEISLEATTKL